MQFAGVNVERKAACRMRDGITLYADIYRPAAAGAYPVLLMRQPYGRMLASTVTYAHPVWYVGQGYIVVIQDVRGRGESEGSFTPFIQEIDDGYDTVEWAAALPGSTGKVGMYGFSYQGTTQWAAAAARPPHLTAIAPAMCAADLYHGMFYPHGRFAVGSFLPWAFQLARDEARRAGDGATEQLCSQLMRHPETLVSELPLLREHPVLAKYFPFYYEWCGHPRYDEYWADRNLLPRALEEPLPALHIGGWFDNYLGGTLQTYAALQDLPEAGDRFHRLVIGPWGHIPWGRKAGGEDYGPEAEGNLHEAHLRWFDHWLKGKPSGLEREPAISYFELGSKTWRSAEHLPKSEAAPISDHIKYFLASDGKPANGASGGGMLAAAPRSAETGSEADVYVYDARLPMPCSGYLPSDRSTTQDRYEILNYTSAPLAQPVRLWGAPQVSVSCQSLEGETDLVAILTAVDPDGKARFLSIGRGTIIGAEHSDWERVAFAMRPLAVSLEAGASVRLELTSSAFPLFVRHPNRIGAEELPHATPEQLQMTAVAVFRDEARSSWIELPVADNAPKREG
ncbi:CocE/NonD family hydrolase [Paenibacillus sp. 1P07SE]|uniref:CocE/NonD family hydrolase n=1 Tax=Paenibacillus sp. 1P07SE TaxID=3132209 RepID=UPI0039A6791B